MKDWPDFLRLFAGEKASLRYLSVLSKSGKFVLYLPIGGDMADATLRLYPAQSLFARSVVMMISGFIRCGVQVSGKKASFPIDEDAPFSQFLRRLAPGVKGVPNFGIFANRITESGRPFVLLVFDADGRPAVVVKVGISDEARRLIEGEQEFFFPERPRTAGLSIALDLYRGEDASAIAYRYAEGTAPMRRQHGKIESLMNSWIWDDETTRLTELSVWPKVETLLHDNPGLKPIFEVLMKCQVKPVIAHGDFAPWNVRVSSFATNAEWMILDWERGVRRGVPGWDWFNFVMQYHTWVRRASFEAIMAEFETLWESPGFRAYARRTGIEPVVKELAFVYLLYFLRYLNLRAKTARLRLFVQEFQKRYFPGIVMVAPQLKISVVTPSYRQLPWLKLSVASVEDQQGVSVEHIIQDAQSGPELDEWVHNHSKARLYSEADSGMYDAINRGFARATGDVVCWLNSDEQYLEGALAKVENYFETHPEIDVLFGDALLIENTGRLLSYRRAILPNQMHIQLSHLNILSCATFVRRSVLERGYLLNTRWKAIADAVWIVDLIKAGIPMAVLNEPLAVFTITDKNLGRSSLAMTEAERWQQQIPLGKRFLRPFFVWRHRLNKLVSGAYWPRFMDLRLYTLTDYEHRSKRSASFLGFQWPNST